MGFLSAASAFLTGRRYNEGMELGLSTLLEGVIDYAGLFPPAKLGMPEAVGEYVSLRNGPHSWLVSRFAVSVNDLAALGAELETHELDEVLPLTVIGTSSNEKALWKGSLEKDLAALRQFTSRFGERAFVEAFEVRIPSNDMAEEAIREVEKLQVEDLFVELPWGPGMEDSIAAIAGSETIFAKVRTGGLDRTAFPSSDQLALFLQQCVQLDLPHKLTAGLHNPLPHHDSHTGARMHGFVNVLAAVALTFQEDYSVAEIAQVLNEERPRAFAFSDEGLSYNGIEVPMETLEVFISFGSCSVKEPAEGLATAGYGSVPVG